MASYAHTAFTDESEFLDAEPLHLSTGSTGLDGFDFNLLDEEDNGERLFADSRASADLARMLAISQGSAGDSLANSRGSSGMDFQEFDTLEASISNSLNNMRFDSIQEENGGMRSSGMSLSSSRGSVLSSSRGAACRPAPPAHAQRRATASRPLSRSFNSINFDPPAAQNVPYPARRTSRQRFGGIQKQTSHGDLFQRHTHTSHSDLSMAGDQSMTSYATAPSQNLHSPQPERQVAALRLPTEEDQPSEGQYNEALYKLAQSMKRSNESRRHMIHCREMLTPQQQEALTTAKEQLQQMNHQVQQQVDQQVVAAPVPQGDVQQCPQASVDPLNDTPSSSRVTAFLSGSRGTLTTGLEQSRKQLSVYMGQMKNQTL